MDNGPQYIVISVPRPQAFPTAAALHFLETSDLSMIWVSIIDRLALALFVLRVLTDYSDASFSFDDFAFLANRFYRRSNLHEYPPFLKSDGTCPHLGAKRHKKRSLLHSSYVSIALSYFNCKQNFTIL